jgi:hypothetical protein
LETFFQVISSAATVEFGPIGQILITLTDIGYEDPEFDPEDFSEVKDPFRLKRDRHLNILKKLDELRIAYDEKRVKLYEFVWGQMRLQSKDLVMRTENFEEEIYNDPIKLVGKIRETHIPGHVSIANPVKRKKASEKHYQTMRQYENESVNIFRHRFDQAVRGLQTTGATVPSQQELAVDFIDKLHNSMYGHYKQTIDDNVEFLGGEYPQTVDEVFQAVLNAKVPKGPGRMAAVFHTSADNKKGKRNPNKEAKDSNESKDETSNLARVKCYCCGKMGHYAKNCPERKQVPVKNAEEKDKGSYHTQFQGDDDWSFANLVSLPATSGHVLHPYCILLDPQSEGHLFNNDKLLSDIEDDPTGPTFSGVGGKIKATQCGLFYGKVQSVV